MARRWRFLGPGGSLRRASERASTDEAPRRAAAPGAARIALTLGLPLLAGPLAIAPALPLVLVISACSGGSADAPAFTDFKALSTGVERPTAAAKGEVVAYLVASDGELTIRDLAGAAVPNAAGMPLLASDTLTPAKGALALVLLHNGYTVRIDGGVALRVDDLAVFSSAPAAASIEDQLRASLSADERARLGDANERIGGWQLRRTALDTPAPEAAPVAASPAPISQPRAAQGGAAPDTEEAEPTPAKDDEGEVGGAGGAGRAGDDGFGQGAPESPKAKKRDRPADHPTTDPPSPNRSPTPTKVPADAPEEADDDAEVQESSRGSKTPEEPAPASSDPSPKSSTTKSSGSTTAIRWQLESSAWTTGSGDKPGASVLDPLDTCMTKKAGTKATVILTIANGVITGVTVDQTASGACLTGLKGVSLRGAGTLSIKLIRR